MSMQKERISIKDIAEAAGVSHPTVSRALSGKGRVSAATRARIRSIAVELGYTPNMIGRSLVTQRSYAIGLVVSNIADPFHSVVAQGVEEEALRQGYSLVLGTAGADPDREYEVVRSFQSRHVDGIIVSSSRVGNRYADLLQETGIPIVLINTHSDGDNMHAVYHDDYGGMVQIVRHLINGGHRHIAHINNERGGKARMEREQAWNDEMVQAGLTPALLFHGHNGRFEGGAAAATQLLSTVHHHGQSMPSAICCYNDTMAAGVMRVLRDHGFSVPEDVRLTGFDDVDFAAYLDPPLTTWQQPRRQMGEAAVRLMLKLFDSSIENNGHQREVMTGQLMVRASG